MQSHSPHSFHIPVMGLGYTVDTPLKVARLGISSAISIIEDNLLEQLREHYCAETGHTYIPIPDTDVDHRAKRVTAYLNLLGELVHEQIEKLKSETFEKGSDLIKYFELLDAGSPIKYLYNRMLKCENEGEKALLKQQLKSLIFPGSIDVNIMTKCDRTNYGPNGELLPSEYSDAHAALRGYAMSDLSSSLIFSAGMNPRLYSYCETFPDFYPNKQGKVRKKIILKVSDYRSALIQGKVLAKKGLLVSEFRIESGLNCGGHAFPTEGLLLGPILEKFLQQKDSLSEELFSLCNEALKRNHKNSYTANPGLRLTVQGGIGTSEEDQFLRNFYKVDSTGWGSPFLLVPEATNVDDSTLHSLTSAQPEDYYLSYASPLGLAFNNFRLSSSNRQRQNRINNGKPGSPCYKKFLAFDTEFTEKPICTASRKYQHLKINQLKQSGLEKATLQKAIDGVMEKDCLCEGLGASVLVKNDIVKPRQLNAVAICPGPNLKYFSGRFTLREMIDHIYGRAKLLNKVDRPHMFLNELEMYIDYLIHNLESGKDLSKEKYHRTFCENLQSGIKYYQELIPKMHIETKVNQAYMLHVLERLERSVKIVFRKIELASLVIRSKKNLET